MSLTRAEWEQMWESLKNIEYYCGLITKDYPTTTATLRTKRILEEVYRIESQVQSVIGQMETK